MARRRKSSPEGTILMRNGRLEIKQRNRWRIYWSGQMISDMRRYYPDTPNAELEGMFGCSIRTLTDKARELGISKNLEYERQNHKDAISSMNFHNRRYGNSGMYGRGREPEEHHFKKGMPALNRRAVRNLDTGEIYESAKEAARKLGVMPSTISDRCNHPDKWQKGKNRAKLEWVEPTVASRQRRKGRGRLKNGE